MYPRFYLNRAIVAVAALFTLTACERNAAEGEATLTAPAVEARTPSGPSSENVSGEVRIMLGSSKVMTANTNSSRSRVLRWSSNNSSVASITSSGLLRGVATGTAIVSVTGSGVDQAFRVIVESAFDPEVVASVQLATMDASLAVGGSTQLAAVALNATGAAISGRTISWRVSSGTAVSVSDNGLVTGVSPGTATVQATADGISGSMEMTVRAAVAPPAVTAVAVTASTGLLTVGNTIQMKATATTATGVVVEDRPATWSVSAGTAVSVSAAGLVTATSAGTATVKAIVDGVSGVMTLTVINNAGPPQVVKTVTVSSPSLTMTVGSSMQMSALAEDASGAPIYGRTVDWRVYSSAVSISSGGVLTATGTGNMLVRARIDGVNGYRTITVTAATAEPKVTSFVISPKTGSSLAPGNTRQFTTSAVWSDNVVRPVSVTYTATGGTISSSGLFSAGQLAGTFLIVANCSCGPSTIADSAYVAVSVPAPQLSTLTISPRNVTLAASATQQFTTTATWSTGASALPPVTYTATGGYVSTGGLYTAPTTAGTYRVIVAHTGGTKKDTATVVVQATTTTPPPASPPPAAGTWSIQRNFNSGSAGSNATSADGFDDAAGGSMYSTERAFEGGKSAKLSIAQGTDGWGTWGGVINFPTPLASGSNLWLQLYIYMPSDFVISTPGNGSLKFLRVRTQPPGGGNSGYNDIQFQDDAGQPSAFRMIKEQQDQWFNFGAPNSFTKGMWHRISVNIQFGSVPKASGGTARVRVWQNGALLVDEARMKTLTNADDIATNFYLFTYWNGSAPRTQSLWVDDIQLSNFQPAWASDLN